MRAHVFTWAILLAAAGALPADAQTAAGTTVRPDPTGIFTIQDENASISTASLTDRYYVNGLRAGYTTGTDGVPDLFASLGHTLYGDGVQRLSFDLAQQIFTPAETASRRPPPGDRPYAGILMANLGLLTDSEDTRSTVSIGLGVVGPWALAEQVQNGFHDLIGQGKTNGWHYQLHNEPAVEIRSGRVWRLPTGRLLGLETDALPDLSAGVGTVRIYALGGLRARIGQGLDADYGPARVEPGQSGGDAFTPVRGFAWYVFAGADGQAVARDVTLDGNSFRTSPSVKLTPFVGEFEGGLALMAFGARLTYTHVLQTAEFKHQKGGLHQFGSLALSVRF